MCALAAVAGLIAGCGSAGSSGATASTSGLVTITYVAGVPGGSTLPFNIGLYKGIFKKYGLNIKVSTGTTAAAAAAIAGGKVDMAEGAPANMVAAIARTGAAKVMFTNGFPDFQVYAQKSVSSVQALKGATVGSTVAGSGGSQALDAYLKANGLNAASDVKVVYLQQYPTVLAALEHGTISAGVLSPPSTIMAQEAGLKLLKDVSQYTLPSVFVVTNSFAKAHPGAVVKFIEAFAAATKLGRDNEQVAVGAMKQYIDLTNTKIADQIWLLEKTRWAVAAFSPHAMAEAEAQLSPPVTVAPSSLIDDHYLDDAGKSSVVLAPGL